MATAQPNKSRSGTRRSAGASRRPSEDVERDENYNLIAVLHRSLREAERCSQYCEDAEEVGDSQLLEFFESTREQQRQLAAKARKLLVERIADAGDGEDDEDEE
jgi:hypothetical protein